MSEWTTMTAADLGRAIGAGQADPVDVTEAFLERINQHPMAGRIYARLTPDRARAEAKAAAKRAKDGLRLSALDGVPVSWKDLFDTAGTATEAGSTLLKGRIPATDATVLRRATALGLVCLGKTHMSELAFSGLGLNPVTETSPCVNDEAAVSGGSSSGAAASVAYGLAAAAVGSDTGGSVRIPAAWNDLVGLKTTSGRLPLSGVVPLAARFDTIGPLTRSVEDAALMLGVLEGQKPIDIRGAGGLEGRRFAVLQTQVMDDLRDAPQAAYFSAVERMKAAGAHVEELEFPALDGAMADAGTLFAAEAYGTWSDAIEANPDVMFPPILERFRGGAAPKAMEYVAAWQRLEETRSQWQEQTAGFDAVLCPTAPNLPPNLDQLMEQGDYYVTENLLTLRNTRVGNLLGLCAITLPTGVPSCGVLLMAAPYQEAGLLRLALAVEAVLS